MTPLELIRKFAELPGFRTMPQDTGRLLAKSGIERIFRKEMAVHYQGEKAETAWLVVSGRIRRIKYRADQATLSLGDCGPGDWLGVPEIFVPGPYLTDCLTAEESVLLALNRTGFLRLMDDSFIRGNIIQSVSREYYRVHSQIEEHSPIERMARLFLSRSLDAGKEPAVMNVTQEELADLIGFARETTNKNLKKLESLGMISVSRGKIMILDEEGLRKLVQE